MLKCVTKKTIKMDSMVIVAKYFDILSGTKNGFSFFMEGSLAFKLQNEQQVLPLKTRIIIFQNGCRGQKSE